MVDDETPRESSAEAQEGADAAAPAAPADAPAAAQEGADAAAPAAAADAPAAAQEGADAAAPAAPADAPAAAQEGAPSGDADAGPAAQSGDEEAAPSAPRRGAPTEDDDADEAPRQKPAVPGADLEVDIVLEGVDPLSRGALGDVDPYADESDGEATDEAGAEEAVETQPITQVAIDLGADARYGATGKRKTAIARVILRPGTGEYRVNGRALNEHFPRPTLQRNIRQPLETVGYEARMDVVALLEGGGISAQADALRHGISRALLEADPNLRGELKRRGFLTRDARAKERKKAGLKKARKRPQFSKR